MSKQVKSTPKASGNSLIDSIKHWTLCGVTILCYAAVGSVILIYIAHLVLPDRWCWLNTEQKKIISDLLSGGFIVFVIGKITDKI
jgi:hypothetical protein